MRWFFVLEIYMLLTMMKEQSHVGYLLCIYYISYLSSRLHNISELHNSSMLYNSLEFQYHIVHKSNNIQFIVTQVSLNYLNGASLQENSLLRYTLYTSSVQDLHLPLRFLLQRQSHASFRGKTLELSISYD